MPMQEIYSTKSLCFMVGYLHLNERPEHKVVCCRICAGLHVSYYSARNCGFTLCVYVQSYALFWVWTAYVSRLIVSFFGISAQAEEEGTNGTVNASFSSWHKGGECTKDGTVDFRGRPAIKAKTGGWRTSWFIYCKSPGEMEV